MCGQDHLTSKCDSWRNKSTSKMELYGQAWNLPKKICMMCLEPGHTSYYCKSSEEVGCPCGSYFNYYICVKTPDCQFRKNWVADETSTTESKCSKTNSGHGNIGKPSIFNPNGVPMGKSLLPVQVLDTNDGIKLRTMFDNCSQSTFLNMSTAKKWNMRGFPIRYTLVCTDGREEPKVGKLYNLVLVDRNGRSIHIQAVGIDKLSGNFAKVKVTGIQKVFTKEVADEDLDREAGDLELLIGTDPAELHPTPVEIQFLIVYKC